MPEWWDVDYTEIFFPPNAELGRGAFGVVSRAKWRLQDVAVKQLLNHGDPHLSDKQLTEFKAEAKIMMLMR